VAGDINGDNSFNIADFTYLLDYLFTGGPEPACYACGDMNGDGEINVADVNHAINALLFGGPLPVCR